jgi:bifunctional non-homologous end joining protein LigD
VGALVCGYFDGTKFVYAGRVGTGYTRRTAHELWERLQPLRRKSCPFAGTLTTMQKRGVVWLEPEIVAQVNYTGWTSDNLLRHAAFVGLREDKPALEVRKPPANEGA